MSKWISVEDKMPPEFEEVMFFYIIRQKEGAPVDKRDIVCGHYAEGHWHICYLYNSTKLNNGGFLKVTHWMPLPDYPKEYLYEKKSSDCK